MAQIADVLLLVVPTAPLLAWLLVQGASRAQTSRRLAIVGCGVSFLAAAGLTGQLDGAIQRSLFDWLHVPGKGAFSASIGLRMDGLSAGFLCVTSFVALCILWGRPVVDESPESEHRFCAGVLVSLFAAHLALLADDFLLFFLFWQLSLFAGFVLSAAGKARAGFRLFAVNRMCDVLLGAGLLLTWYVFGSLKYADVLSPTQIAELIQRAPSIVVTLCLCLFAGVVGRTGQFPLSLWHGEAVPARVRAVLHGVSLLPIGIYAAARAEPLFLAAGEGVVVVGYAGAFSALMSAFMAVGQSDSGRTIALISAALVGVGLSAVGTVGGAGASVYLVLCQMPAVAALLLAMGRDVESCDGRDSGCRDGRRSSSIIIVAAALVLGSGLWGAGGVLACLWEAGGARTTTAWIDVAAFGLIAAALARRLFLWKQQPHDRPLERNNAALVLLVLVAAVGGAGVGVVPHMLTQLWGNVLSGSGGPYFVLGMGLPAVLAGVVFAWLLFGRELAPDGRWLSRFDSFVRLSRTRLYEDVVWRQGIVLPARLASGCARVVEWLVVECVGRGLLSVPRWLWRVIAPLHQGSLSFYALSMLLTAAVLLVVLLVRGAGG